MNVRHPLVLLGGGAVAGAVLALLVRFDSSRGSSESAARPHATQPERDSARGATPLRLDRSETDELARAEANSAPTEVVVEDAAVDPVEVWQDPAEKYDGCSKPELVKAFNSVEVEIRTLHDQLADEWFRNGWDEVEIVEPGGEVTISPTDPGPGPDPYFIAAQRAEWVGGSYVSRVVEIPTGYSTELDRMKCEAGWLRRAIYADRKPSKLDYEQVFVGPIFDREPDPE